ncbi:MAG: NYN domain-containing protein [Nitrospiraceae bacterium]
MPDLKTIVFMDGQNIYHLAKEAWLPKSSHSESSYSYPCYDVEKLADILIASSPGRIREKIRFYTGVPHHAQNPFWHGFWSNKLRFLGSRGIHVYKGRINHSGQEKGVDVSLAIDLIQLTHEKAYDVAIIVSQDQDFGPAIKLAKAIARDQQRTLVFESAFPCEITQHPWWKRPRGVPGTKWSYIDKPTYDACFDPTDYRVH